MAAYARSKPKPNTGEHIKDIVSRTECKKHKVPTGVPCFHIKFDSVNAYGAAICNDRVVKAGFVGQISSGSSSRSSRPNNKRPSSR
jgi:hypothetical protein